LTRTNGFWSVEASVAPVSAGVTVVCIDATIRPTPPESPSWRFTRESHGNSESPVATAVEGFGRWHRRYAR
jgi:hypothetical protein